MASFGGSALPRALLINPQGVVVFDSSDFTEDELRSEMVKLGAEYAALAPKPPQGPCRASE